MATNEPALPTPVDIKEMDSVLPGYSHELLRQLRHRRRIDTAKIALAYLGPVLGFIVVMSFLATAAYLINAGHGLAGTFLGVVDIVSLAGVFVVGGRLSLPDSGDNQ